MFKLQDGLFYRGYSDAIFNHIVKTVIKFNIIPKVEKGIIIVVTATAATTVALAIAALYKRPKNIKVVHIIKNGPG
jgi:hypothetical protein